MTVCGYLSKRYAESFLEFGTLSKLPRCRGWILERQIPGFLYHDAIGCYPRFCCQDWSSLHKDLKNIGDELVSLALVTDPFGNFESSHLHDSFDIVIPYKEHFVVDLRQPAAEIGTPHHRRMVRKSLKNVSIERCLDPALFLDEWVSLYANIIVRHEITGISAFSRAAFKKQLSVPGTVMFRADYQDKLIGLHWYYEQNEVVYAHLAALGPECYHLEASYALHWSAIDYFSGKRSWLDLGAGAGIHCDGTDGLSKYKRGWSTGTQLSYFCGRVFDQKRYSELVKLKKAGKKDFFPAYRQP